MHEWYYYIIVTIKYSELSTHLFNNNEIIPIITIYLHDLNTLFSNFVFELDIKIKSFEHQILVIQHLCIWVLTSFVLCVNDFHRHKSLHL